MHALEKWLAERKQSGCRVTQTALAKRVGCTPSWLTAIIKGEGTPSLPLAKRLSDETGIPIEQFAEDAA